MDTCIYCFRPFHSRAGKGDHVIPAALGEFEGDLRFKHICRTCNSKIGRCEQQLVQAAPEGFFRAIVQPKSKRLRKRPPRRQRGAMGAPPPTFTMTWNGRELLVEPSTQDPRNATQVDQLRLVDEHGTERTIRLYPDMSVDALRAQIEKQNSGSVKHTELVCNDASTSQYKTFLAQIWPDWKSCDERTTEPGIYEVQGRATFHVTEAYFQVLAKMAFHYYLTRSQRGFRGDELAFAEIRQFIMHGGDHGKFVSWGKSRFRLPFGPMSSRPTASPHRWCHVLAADEENNPVLAYVNLFVGPGCVSVPYCVSFQRPTTRILIPSPAWGHVYVYDQQHPNPNYCGRVIPASLTRLRQ
jgi:hypothetical protein